MNGKDIIKLRKHFGESQKAFGKRIGRSRPQIARYEAGKPIPDHVAYWIIPNKIKNLDKIINS